MHKNSHCDNFARPPISSIRPRAVSWLSDRGCPGHASGPALSTMEPSRLATKSRLPSMESPQFTTKPLLSHGGSPRGRAMTVRAVAAFARRSRRFATKPLLSHGGSPRGRHDCPRSRRVRTQQPAVRHAVVAGPSSSRHGAAGPATRSPRTATQPSCLPWGRVE